MMRRPRFLLVMALALVAKTAVAEAPVSFSVQQATSPLAMPAFAPPATVAYQDCVTHSCRLVPEVKQIKKTVYEVRVEQYCLKKLPPLLSLFGHHGCDQCAACQPPRYRKVLVKKEVVCQEICTSKCTVEQHVERVPCQP